MTYQTNYLWYSNQTTSNTPTFTFVLLTVKKVPNIRKIKECQSQLNNVRITIFWRIFGCFHIEFFPNKNLNLSHFYVGNVLNFAALPFFFLLLLSVTVFETISSERCFRSEISLQWLEIKELNELLHKFIFNHTQTINLLIFSTMVCFLLWGMVLMLRNHNDK